MLNVAKNIKISIEYKNWHNIVYIYQFLTRNLYISYFFGLLEFDYFLALQHDNWAPRTSPGPAQDHGFGPLKHKILTFGLYSIDVKNIEINGDNHAKFQVKIYMLTILKNRLNLSICDRGATTMSQRPGPAQGHGFGEVKHTNSYNSMLLYISI